MSTHIGAAKGDIAESILLPGDPLRAKYIAEKFFDNPIQFNNVRGMLGYTGTYKGKRVSTMGTGMGIPSISIYVTELLKEYGCKNLVRVGTCGGLLPEIGLKDIILAQGACTDNAFLNIFPGHYAPIANFDLLRTAHDLACQRNIKTYVGLVKSSDMFYYENVPGSEYWTQYGVIGVEMEAAALYTIAAKYKARALAICSVSDSAFIDHELTALERERNLDNMLTLALDTVLAID
ncbi:MAG: purine-nucleoside phosphorylase [Oscillospiraceae bacterium]|nr:purine-nucleoside phosphorylase [Oscillospiraceae bacterium]